MISKKFNISRLFYISTALYAFFWTLLPAFVRYNLPLDSLEGATWGQHLQWGYDKDPLLNAWLTRLAVEVGHYHPWVIYLFSQFAIAICFWAVWQLGRKILDPWQALAAVFMLMGMQYYNIAAIDFNDNVLEISLWTLTVLCFYQALHRDHLRDWISVGVLAGLAFLAKYFVLMLLIPMLLLMVWEPTYRRQWKKPGVYVGLAVFLALITPHLVWLFQHDFITLRYSTHQVGGSTSWMTRVDNPFHFMMLHALAFCVPATLYGAAWGSVRGEECVILRHVVPKDLRFILFTSLGPILLTLLIGMITGGQLNVLWGMPLISLSGILFFVITRAPVTPKIFYRFAGAMMLCVSIMGIGYGYVLMHKGSHSSANYPGKEIALYATALWHAQFHTPLMMVAGPRWVAGNVAFYSADHPEVFINGDPLLNPWWQEEKMRHTGVLWVWDGQDAPFTLPPEVQKHYPQMRILPKAVFHWHRERPGDKNVEIFFAVIPPEAGIHL